MSSFDKVVKLACKPKSAPPKSKYLDTIIAATWSEDGAVHDVCKALAPRFREPNSIVVFKALIVLHTMVRNGATDNVLGYLSSTEVLRLRNVSSGSWDGYSAPQNLQNYAAYLDSRIRAYRDLKHDAIRVQAESNRDMRTSNSIEEDSNRSRKGKGGPPPSPPVGPARSKTIMGRKLRVMTVEKGLLRETKAVHRMIDALAECRFYLDDLEDELNITALRMLVKDLLILFQAGNEGVINVLEHYFEMSHVDATEALAIYRHFCKQTERVVEFLGVAKKLQNLLNVPIPNLKHAPVSLAGALQEYLEDPAFEQNRIEYKATKEAADKADKRPATTPKSTESNKQTNKIDPPSASAPASTSATQPPTSNTASNSSAGNKNIVDFFNAIEEEQPTMFNPQTNSPNTSYFQTQSASNPFAQMQMASQPFPQVQQTSFLQPQHTAFQIPQSNPFNLSSQSQPPQNGHPPFSAFLPQPTGIPQPNHAQAPGLNSLQLPQQSNFLQPQITGVNPFRQSMMFPQTTGMALFSGAMGNSQTQGGSTPFQNRSQGSHFNATQPSTATGIAFSATTSIASPFAQNNPIESNSQASHLPARPSSTPLTMFGSTKTDTISPPMAQPVKTHQTGTKNPFGPIIPAPPPPVPKAPTLMELGMGVGGINGSQSQQSKPPEQLWAQEPSRSSSGLNSFNTGALSAGKTDMSSVASSFSFSKPNTNPQISSLSSFPPAGALNSQGTSSSTNMSESISSSLSSQPTGMNSASSAPSIPPVKTQITGFSGLKPFKPTSAFGASLLESLPPIPGSEPSTPAMTNNPTGIGAIPNVNSSSTLNGFGPTTQTTNTLPNQFGAGTTSTFGSGSSLGTGLRPQMTGGGAANPFRASMMGLPTGAPGLNSSSPLPPLPGLPSSSTVTFGSSLFSGTSGALNAANSPFGQKQQQPQSSNSLI